MKRGVFHSCNGWARDPEFLKSCGGFYALLASEVIGNMNQVLPSQESEVSGLRTQLCDLGK